MWVLWTLLAAAAVVVLLSFAVYRFSLYSPRGNQNNDYAVARTPQMDPLRDRIMDMIHTLNERPYERVSITSFDGLKLAGRYYHQADGAPLDMCFHGYRGTPSRDFSGGTSIYFRAGHNVLMVEERGQCGSEGHTITMGVKERRDCLDWIAYALERFGPDQRIILNGISMGAATVLMASGMGLPENVKGIVADCPYTSPEAIMKKVVGDMKLPQSLSWVLIRLGARLFGGVDLTGVDAAEAVKDSPVPILLIHGEDDRFVPCEMSRRIAAANPEMIELYTFPGAGHGLSYLVDEARYTALAEAFAGKVLGETVKGG